MKMQLLALTGLAIVAGCRPVFLTTPPAGELREEAVLRETLLRSLPKGTPLAAARHLMEQQGFTCSLERNSSFVEKAVRHDGIDFLYCVRSDTVRRAGITRHWGIAVVTDGGVVTDVLVTCVVYGAKPPAPAAPPTVAVPAVAAAAK